LCSKQASKSSGKETLHYSIKSSSSSGRGCAAALYNSASCLNRNSTIICVSTRVVHQGISKAAAVNKAAIFIS
jgi:hypothetical protein